MKERSSCNAGGGHARSGDRAGTGHFRMFPAYLAGLFLMAVLALLAHGLYAEPAQQPEAGADVDPASRIALFEEIEQRSRLSAERDPNDGKPTQRALENQKALVALYKRIANDKAAAGAQREYVAMLISVEGEAGALAVVRDGLFELVQRYQWAEAASAFEALAATFPGLDAENERFLRFWTAECAWRAMAVENSGSPSQWRRIKPLFLAVLPQEGDDDLLTAAALSRLALIASFQGHYDEAEALFQRVSRVEMSVDLGASGAGIARAMSEEKASRLRRRTEGQ